MKRFSQVGMELLSFAPIALLVDMFVAEKQSLLVKMVMYWIN